MRSDAVSHDEGDTLVSLDSLRSLKAFDSGESLACMSEA
jgi:hypothetical protein